MVSFRSFLWERIMTHDENFLRDLLRIVVWYPLRWMLLVLPINGCLSILRWMGDIHFAFSIGKRNLLIHNIRKVVGDRKIQWYHRQIREYFRNHYVDRLMIFIFPRFMENEINRFIEFKGLENLDHALQEGNGVILVHGHFGPVHIPLVVLARLGYGMKQIGLPSDEGLSRIGRKVAFRLRLHYESMIPAEIVKADGFLRPVFKWLHQNGVVMITGDGTGTEQRVGRHSLFRFCNQPVLFPIGPSLLAEKTGASFLPMFLLPGQKKPFCIIIEPPLTVDVGAIDGATNRTEKFVGRLQHYVLQYPGWMHFLDRFTEGKMVASTIMSRYS
jgi:lauroyl/myristoyl acyltransferase